MYNFQEAADEMRRQSRKYAHLGAEQGITFEGGMDIQKQMFIYSLILLHGTQLVYEIGMNAAGTSVFCCEALKTTGGNYVGFELAEKRRPVLDVFSSDHPNAEIVWGDSKQTVAAYAAENNHSPGMVIVDGDHSEGGCSADARVAKEIVKPGGFIVLDDTNNGYVSFVAEEIAAGFNHHWFFQRYPAGGGTGLLVLQQHVDPKLYIEQK